MEEWYLCVAVTVHLESKQGISLYHFNPLLEAEVLCSLIYRHLIGCYNCEILGDGCVPAIPSLIHASGHQLGHCVPFFVENEQEPSSELWG